jgi:ADP-ribose pyrophosphatase
LIRRYTRFRQSFFPAPGNLFLKIPLSKILLYVYQSPMSEEITLYESKWLGLYRLGRWDYVRRPNSDACVGVLAITERDELVLIEQFRIPVQKRVIEIPAGLVGDEPEHKGEDLSETARRELLEETGYRAETMRHLLSSPTSPGMTPEITHLFHATDLHLEHEGGGIAGEDITVHIVPLAGLRVFLAEKEAAGAVLDFKIHAALGAAGIAF